MPKLQHIRSTTPDKRPDPALLVDGQLAINTAAATPGFYTKDDAGGLIKIGPTFVGPAAPNSSPSGSAGNSVGEHWMDTSVAPPVLRVWDGASWLAGAGGQGPQGEVGPQGPPGNDGAAGGQGPAGADGAAGAQGPQGEQGIQGESGTGIRYKGEVATVAELPTTGNAQGDLWVIGNRADDTSPAESYIWNEGTTTWDYGGKIQGPQGPAGADGVAGGQGPQGEVGPQGPPGADGAAGPQGEVGPQGPPGADSTVPGPAGADGAAGPQGPAGVDGAAGAQGPAGVDGAAGPEGPPGPNAVSADWDNQIILGTDGLVYTPRVAPSKDAGNVIITGMDGLVYASGGKVQHFWYEGSTYYIPLLPDRMICAQLEFTGATDVLAIATGTALFESGSLSEVYNYIEVENLNTNEIQMAYSTVAFAGDLLPNARMASTATITAKGLDKRTSYRVTQYINQSLETDTVKFMNFGISLLSSIS